MTGKYIQDLPIMHLKGSKIQNFLKQSNQGTLLVIVQAHEIIKHY